MHKRLAISLILPVPEFIFYLTAGDQAVPVAPQRTHRARDLTDRGAGGAEGSPRFRAADGELQARARRAWRTAREMAAGRRRRGRGSVERRGRRAA